MWVLYNLCRHAHISLRTNGSSTRHFSVLIEVDSDEYTRRVLPVFSAPCNSRVLTKGAFS